MGLDLGSGVVVICPENLEGPTAQDWKMLVPEKMSYLFNEVCNQEPQMYRVSGPAGTARGCSFCDFSPCQALSVQVPYY